MMPTNVCDEERGKRPTEILCSPDEAMCFKYEIYYIWQAAQNVRDKPARNMVENMSILDNKIKALSNRIEDMFGELAEDRTRL